MTIRYFRKRKPQKEFKYKVKNALLSSLPDDEQWRILSLSQSKRSKSVYIYLYFDGKLYPIRVSNHLSWFRGVEQSYLNIKVDFKNNLSIDDQIKQQFDRSEVPTIDLKLEVFLVLQMIYSIHEPFNPVGIFLRDNKTLTIEGTRKGKPVLVQNLTIHLIVQNLIEVNLIRVHTNGYLSVTHNGFDILRKYKQFRRSKWPSSIKDYDWYSSLQRIYSIVDGNVSYQRYNKNAKPDYRDDLDYYYQLFNVSHDSQEEPRQQVDESPKFWRQSVIKLMKDSLPYGSALVAVKTVLRKRIVYIQVMTGDLLYFVCFTDKQILTLNSKCNVYIVPQAVNKLKNRFSKTFPLYEYRYVKINQQMIIWLRYLQLMAKFSNKVFIAPNQHNVIVEKSPDQTLQIFPSYHFFPSYHYDLLGCMTTLGWVDVSDNRVKLADIGQQILDNYRNAVFNESKSWNLSINTMKMKNVEHLLINGANI